VNAFYSATTTLAQLVYIGCEVAIVAVVATVVKRQRPDAYRGLLAWSIGSLVAGLAFTAAYPLMSVFVSLSGDGTDSYFQWLAVIALARMAVEVALVVVLIKGLVALAQPPKPPVVPSAGTYR